VDDALLGDGTPNGFWDIDPVTLRHLAVRNGEAPAATEATQPLMPKSTGGPFSLMLSPLPIKPSQMPSPPASMSLCLVRVYRRPKTTGRCVLAQAQLVVATSRE
jgi:hypothetical protein